MCGGDRINKREENPESCGDKKSGKHLLEEWLTSHSEVLKDPWEGSEWEDTSPVNGNPLVLDPTMGKDNYCEIIQKKRLGGDCSYVWANGDIFKGHMENGLKSGYGLVTSPEKNIVGLYGDWRGGRMEGKGRLVTQDTTVMEGWFRNSCLHGLARKIEIKKFRTFRQQVTWLGRYRSGVAHGRCWQWQEGGGYITGIVDAEGEFSGDDIAFVYPDLETALVGIFAKGVMISGKPAELEAVDIIDDIAEPVFSISDTPVVRHCRSSKESVGQDPLVVDQYEARTVQVRSSQVEGGGEGLYAKRDIRKGEIVAFYNGIRLLREHGEAEDWETSGYKIFANTNEQWGERIDLPGDLIYLDNYCATLGHKVNHSFVYNCTEWFFKHPRHDLIPCTKAITDIQAGKEIFLHYGYDPRNCPAWYGLALDKFLQDNPDMEQMEAADPERLEKGETPWYVRNILNVNKKY